MRSKRYSVEQIVAKLREAEKLQARGAPTGISAARFPGVRLSCAW